MIFTTIKRCCDKFINIWVKERDRAKFLGHWHGCVSFETEGRRKRIQIINNRTPLGEGGRGQIPQLGNLTVHKGEVVRQVLRVRIGAALKLRVWFP